MEALFLPFTGRRLERRESWLWGSFSRQNKLGIIEAELQKLLQHGLNGLRVFHTFFHHRVTPLSERMRPMWLYSGPTDPVFTLKFGRRVAGTQKLPRSCHQGISYGQIRNS